MYSVADSIYHKFDTLLTGGLSILSIQFFAMMSAQDMQAYFAMLMQGLVGVATIAKIGYEVYKDRCEKRKNS